MECWIGVGIEQGRRVVRLAGRLSAAQVPELFQICVNVPDLTLDLSELVSADVAGVDALQRLRQQGALIACAPGYIQLKLESHRLPA